MLIQITYKQSYNRIDVTEDIDIDKTSAFIDYRSTCLGK